jgi:protein-disulfide isomerase-like protein with CxxC motif
MFKLEYATKAEVPAALASEFIEKDGKWVADTDISTHPSFIALRENKDTILTEKKKVADALRDATAAIDSVKSTAGITDITELAAVLKAKQGQGKEDEEKRFAERIAAMKGETDKTIKELSDARAKDQAHLHELLIDGAIQSEAAKAGVLPTAMRDALRAGREIYRLVDGKPTPMEGDKTIYGKDGVNPMPVSEWFGKQVTEAPHWFKPSQGGGANPGAGARGGAAGAIDPNLSPTEILKAARR